MYFHLSFVIGRKSLNLQENDIWKMPSDKWKMFYVQCSILLLIFNPSYPPLLDPSILPIFHPSILDSTSPSQSFRLHLVFIHLDVI